MKPSLRTHETPTVESLVPTWRVGNLQRREFLQRAALLGVGAAAAGGLLEAAVSRPAWAQSRADLVAAAANTTQSLPDRINAIARVLSGQDSRLAAVLNPVQPPEMPPEGQAALRNALAVVSSIATRMQPYLNISPPPSDWTGGTIPPPPDDDR